MHLEDYLIQHPKKYLIFDLDSTIVLLNIDWSSYRRDLFDLVSTFDKPLTQQVPFVPFAGLELTNRAIKKHGDFAKKKIDTFVEQYETSHYSGYTPNTKLLTFIRTHKKEYVYFIWTSNMKKSFEEFMAQENLNNVFSVIVDRGSTPLLKPEINGFSLMFMQGTSLNEYLMIGDSVFDEGAAINAEIDFFKIDYFSHR